jgi:hypothetical protein
MDNQNIQKAGDNTKQIGQIGEARPINFESCSITIRQIGQADNFKIQR